MDAGEFAGWTWAIIGLVCGAAIAVLVVVSVALSVRSQIRGRK